MGQYVTFEEEQKMLTEIKEGLENISPWPWNSVVGRATPPRIDIYSGEPLGDQRFTGKKGLQRIVVHTHAVPSNQMEENINAEADVNFLKKTPEYIDFLLRRNEFLKQEIMRLKPELNTAPKPLPEVKKESAGEPKIKLSGITHEELLKKYKV